MTTTVTLDLPVGLYEQAKQAAQATKKSLEQVIVDWINPPINRQIPLTLDHLSTYANAELVKMANWQLNEVQIQRMQALFEKQHSGTLTANEMKELEELVGLEDDYTLWKARAMYTLKQRDALSVELQNTLSAIT